MRNIIVSLVALFGLLPAYAAGPKINAATNVDWTKVTGVTAPSATCNSSIYGEPYTNTATGDFYVCSSSGWVLVTSGGGGISGSATSGFLAIGTGAASIGPSLADYGVSVAGTFTFPKPTIFNDGTGVAGTAALQQGTATSNSTTSVTLTVPTSVTSYRIVLPGVHATGSNTFLSCTAADPSVCTWAAGGGGTTTNALTANSSGGAAAGTTFDGSVARTFDYHSFGAQQALTLTTTGSSGAATLSSGTLNIPQYSGGGGTDLISRVSCVTYSCVADGNLAANTGTDNTTPFTNCLTAAIAANGVCYIPAGVYKITGAMPSVTTSGTGFVGDVWGMSSVVSLGTWSGPITQIFTSSASATMLTVSGGAGVITGNSVKNIAWQRSVAPNTGAIGLLFLNTPGVQVSGNTIGASSIGLDITYAPTYGGGTGFSFNQVAFGYAASIGCGAGPLIGFNMHGGGAGFQTMVMNNNSAVNNCGASPTSYGFKADGVIQDLNMRDNGTALIHYGIYFSGSIGQNNEILNQTDDGYRTNGEYFNYGGAGVSTLLQGGESSPFSTSSSYATLIDNSKGVSVENRRYHNPQPAVHYIGVTTGSTGNAIQNNYFYASNNIGIVCNAANGNNYSGNTTNLGGGGAHGIDFTNCSNNVLMANKSMNGGGASIGIVLDSSSNANVYVDLNSYSGSATAYTNAGTGNLSGGGTTTNALTMNNGGSGAASGSTFDGSAAKTISYNSVGAQQALTLTTTGSSGAATLSAGTLNIPQYTGGGGGGAGGDYINLCSVVTLTNATCSNGLITGGTTPSAITISAIPGTYLNLDVDLVGTLSGSGAAAVNITLNSDTTTTHYFWSRTGTLVAGSATSDSSSTSGAKTAFFAGCLLGGTNQPVGGCHLHLPMYAQSVQKPIQATDWFGDAAANGGGGTAAGEWISTSAITSITFTPSAGTFATGALLTIHGITGNSGANSVPICSDSSGSGTAQSCSTSPTFTPTAGSVIAYSTTTANTGAGLTINVNSLGAKSVAKWQGTTTLAANDILNGKYILMTYDGTNWETSTIGNAPAGGGSGDYANIGGSVTWANCTYASGTCTTSGTQSSITISAIPGTYKNLVIDVVGSTSQATAVGVQLQFNSDTGTHYSWALTSGTTNSGSATGGGSASGGAASIQAGGLGGTNNPAGGSTITIPFYTSGLQKVVESSSWIGSTSLNGQSLFGNGAWNQTSAITSITIFPSASTFAAGTLFTIHGIN